MSASAMHSSASNSSDPLLAGEHAEVVSAPPGRFAEDISPIKAVWFFAKRNLWLIVLCALIGVLVAGVLSLQQAVRYTATAELLIDPTDTRTFGFDPESGMLGSDNVTLATQMRIARSRDVLRAAVERVGLAERFAYGLPSATTAENAWNPILGPLSALLEKLPVDFLLASGMASDLVRLEVPQNDLEAQRAAEQYLADGLDIQQSGEALILEFSFTGRDPAEAAGIVNAVAEVYVEHQLEQKLSDTTRTTSFLETRLGELEDQLRATEESIKNYRAENEMVATAGRTLSEQELSTLTDELIRVRASREDLQGRITYLRNLRSEGDGLETVGEILASPLVSALLQEHIQLKRHEAELLAIYGERHPQVIAVRADLTDIVRQISDEADRYISSLENEISLMTAREQAIRQQMQRATADNVRQSQAEIGLRELERGADALRDLYRSFLMRYTEAREQRQVIEPDARIVALAEAPSRPAARDPGVMLALGFLVGSGLGVGLGWLREVLDHGLRTKNQVEQYLGLSCLGQVPRIQRIGRSDRLQDFFEERPRSGYVESIRSIAAILSSDHAEMPPKVIQVVSALPSEGKTTFAVSLANLLARSGRETLLIDLDLHHPSVAAQVDLEPERCLVDYLLGEASIETVMQSPQPGLTILPVRRSPPDPAAMMGSRRMKQLIEELRGQFEHIVIDTPPILLVADPKITVRLVDTTVLLVRWQETSRNKAVNALRELDAVGAHVAGAVLTQVDVRRLEQYGYAGVGTYSIKYKKYHV